MAGARTGEGDMDRRSFLRAGCVAVGALACDAAFAMARANAVEGSSHLIPVNPDDYAIIRRYNDMGGVLSFSIFDGAEDAEADSRTAIHQVLAAMGPVNEDGFRALQPRHIGEALFFGDCYDPGDGGLIKRGTWKTIDGRELTNPKLTALDGVTLVGGGSALPDPGSGGDFAYAFLNPPYGMSGSPSDLQEVFDGIGGVVLPAGYDSVILDWTTPKLKGVSSYFEAGMEWWGVFLFSIYIPAKQQLTIVTGSATD